MSETGELVSLVSLDTKVKLSMWQITAECDLHADDVRFITAFDSCYLSIYTDPWRAYLYRNNVSYPVFGMSCRVLTLRPSPTKHGETSTQTKKLYLIGLASEASGILSLRGNEIKCSFVSGSVCVTVVTTMITCGS